MLKSMCKICVSVVALAAVSHPSFAKASTTTIGIASYYSSGYRTASGEHFNPNDMTAAHRTLPFGTRLRVTNLSTGRSAVVRINDRGPFVRGRSIDLARGAARAIGMTGNARVEMVQLN